MAFASTESLLKRRKLSCKADTHERELSKMLFKQVNHYRDFVHLWTKFYTNEICLPTYYSVFVSDFGDNKHASFEIGKQYAEISNSLGLVFNDGQQASIADQQREYVTGFCPVVFAPVVKAMCEYLNRFSGMVAFCFKEDWGVKMLQKMSPDSIWPDIPNQMRYFFVTYDYDEKADGVNRSKKSFMRGHGFTPATNSSDVIRMIEKDSWLNDNFKRKFGQDGMIGFEIIDTEHGSQRILPLLKKFANSIDEFPMQLWDLPRYEWPPKEEDSDSDDMEE